MSAITPAFRPAYLLLIAAIVLLGAFSAKKPDPFPDAGTCIDPNGKPRPCDGVGGVPPKALRGPTDSGPRT